MIDYVIVSEDLLSHFSDFDGSEPKILSDHCTVNVVIQNSIYSLFEISQNVRSMNDLDNCVESFVGILDSLCESLFEKKLSSFSGDIPHKNNSNVLYNEECKIKSMSFLAASSAKEIVRMVKIGLKW